MTLKTNAAAAAAMLALAPFAALANGTAEPDASAEPAADAARGADAYDESCAVCHATPTVILRGVPGDDRDARADWLDLFLTEHYAPDEVRRRDIIAWLLERDG